VVAETTCRLLRVPLCVVLLYNEAGRLNEHARSGQAESRLKTINIPIRDGASVLGILRVVERTPGGGLGADDQRLLATLATQVRLALDRVRLVAQTAHTEALIETDRLKSALIASVSHDLRTPLAIMKGATSTILADDLTWDAATQRALTQSIDVEVDHLNRIVGNLLDMSRIEAGALSSERDWQELAEVLGAVLQRLAPALAGHQINVDLPHDLPLVPFNATLIDQVLTNLLENARKYSPAGSPIDIRAFTERGPGATRGVTLVVRDHGPGIPADERARIFDKFYRQGDATSQVAGVGLGLAICKGIIEAHGGRIWVEAPPGGGAAFAFTLPLAEALPARAGGEAGNGTTSQAQVI
jgi:two-component system, OmpR family, sensor histidine kinase KdpD